MRRGKRWASLRSTQPTGLIARVEHGLLAQGIRKCNLYVLDSNEAALAFWHQAGWQVLHYDFRMLQKKLPAA